MLDVCSEHVVGCKSIIDYQKEIVFYINLSVNLLIYESSGDFKMSSFKLPKDLNCEDVLFCCRQIILKFQCHILLI